MPNLSELIQRYDKPGPRYTAYPMPPVWAEHLPESDLLEALKRANADPTPLSLYAHLPFCRRRCAYCGCNVVVSPHYDPVAAFLESLEREADLWAKHLPDRRAVIQMHWGGGTPTYLTVPDLQKTFDLITRRFELLPGAEVSLEADPTFLTEDQLPALRKMGFNRVSFGVQDLDEDVQALITRGQTWDQTLSAVKQARAEGFEGVNLDLVYGLPGQTHDTFRHTLEETLELNPDRLAVYGFAYLPAMLPYQRSIPEEKLPSPEQRLDLLLLASELLEKAGYVAVGMDHFAHPEDPLARAVQDGRLTRNFMGYAVKGGSDMVSLGPSAISDIAGVYHQNDKILSRWESAVDDGRFPMSKGLVCTEEDLMRRWIIHQIMGRFELRWDELKAKWGKGPEHFSDALKQLESEVANGVIELRDEGIFVTELGKRFVRNLVMPFDAYLPGVAGKSGLLEDGVKPDTAILLLNLGGPVNLGQVEDFLYNLFADRELIRLPGPAWFQPTYARGIAKVRTKAAQGRYAEIGGGSPLLAVSAAQAAGLRARLREAGRMEPVKLLFRYSQPRAAGLLKALKRDGVTKLLPVTLYPHDCRATTGSSVRELEREAKALGLSVIQGVESYATDEGYLNPLVEGIRAALEEHPYATVIFSAHSLPMKQIEEGDPYEREIKATVKALKARIGDTPGGCVLAYQSRVGPIRWLSPSLRSTLKTFAGRDVIVVPISFVSEHIETLHELDIQYRKLAEQVGIKAYVRVKTPGVDPRYLDCLFRRTLEALP